MGSQRYAEGTCLATTGSSGAHPPIPDNTLKAVTQPLGVMRSRPTRRQVLVGALGGVAIAGGALSQLPHDAIDTWTPAPGTWPCEHYDLANTAANPHTSVPGDPTVDWRAPAPGTTFHTGFVVGAEHLFTAGERLTAVDTRDGDVRWQHRTAPGLLTVRDGLLYHATTATPDEQPGHLTTFDTHTGALQWQRTLGGTYTVAWDLCVTARTAIVATPELQGFATEDGTRRWESESQFGHADLAAHGGALFGGNGRLVRHRPRTRLESIRDSPPGTTWEVEGSGDWTIVTDEQVIRGGHSLDVDPGSDPASPAMAAVDPETGDRAWELFDAAQIDVEGLEEYSVANPAVAGAEGIAELEVETRDTDETLVGFSATDGTLTWRTPLPTWLQVWDIAVAGDTAVIATADDRGREEAGGSTTGVLIARSLATGTERWRVTTDALIESIVVADETIFAQTGDDEVVALR